LKWVFFVFANVGKEMTMFSFVEHDNADDSKNVGVTIQYDEKTGQLTEQEISFIPDRLLKRRGYFSVHFETWIILFGGWNPDTDKLFNDIFIYSTKTKEWKMSPIKLPNPARDCVAILNHDKTEIHIIGLFDGIKLHLKIKVTDLIESQEPILTSRVSRSSSSSMSSLRGIGLLSPTTTAELMSPSSDSINLSAYNSPSVNESETNEKEEKEVTSNNLKLETKNSANASIENKTIENKEEEHEEEEHKEEEHEEEEHEEEEHEEEEKNGRRT